MVMTRIYVLKLLNSKNKGRYPLHIEAKEQETCKGNKIFDNNALFQKNNVEAS